MKHINKPAQLLDWKLWTGLLISALFIYLALRKVDLPLMWEVIKSSDLSFLSLVIITVFFQFVIRAWRWGILLEPVKKTGFLNRLHSTLIGFAANCILPARLGEFVKANYIGHTESISSSSSFGTIVVERLFDCFTLLLVLFIGLIGTTFPAELGPISGSLRVTGFFLFLFYILLIILLVGFKYKAKSFMKLIGRVLFFLPHYLRSRIIDIIWNFSLGLVIIKNPYKWLQAVFYSFLIWFLSLYQVVLIEQSIGLTLPFIATFIVLAMASFGVMIPSAPGFIGTFHLSVQYGFLFYGIGKEEALSAAILWHAAFFFPTIFFGFISFLILQTSFDKLSEDPDILKRGH